MLHSPYPPEECRRRLEGAWALSRSWLDIPAGPRRFIGRYTKTGFIVFVRPHGRGDFPMFSGRLEATEGGSRLVGTITEPVIGRVVVPVWAIVFTTLSGLMLMVLLRRLATGPLTRDEWVMLFVLPCFIWGAVALLRYRQHYMAEESQEIRAFLVDILEARGEAVPVRPPTAPAA